MRSAIVLVLLLGCAWLLWWSLGDDVPPLEPAAAAEQQEPEPAQPATSDAATRDAEAENEREAVFVPPPEDTTPGAKKTSFTQTVRGRVLHADNTPAAGAGVRAGKAATTAADDGTFTLDVRSPDDDLAAWLAGQEPALVPDVAQLPEVIAGRTIDVVLPGAALTIDGWLFGPDGRPAKGWRLHLHGGAIPVDDSSLPVLSAEDLAAGASVRNDPRGRWQRGVNPNERDIGDDGAFVFGGLRRNRDYVLRAWNQHTLQTAVSPPLRAGTRGYTFVVPQGSFREQVRGRAIDRQGGAIAGVRVRLTMRVHKSRGGESYETGQTVLTDADGRFAFVQVIREDLLLRFDGDQVVTLYHELRADEPGDDVLVRLGTLCRFRFEPSAFAARPTSFRVLDTQGQPLRMMRKASEQIQNGPRLEWKDGDDAREIMVSDEAAWLSIEVDAREVRRVPLQLGRDEVAVVRG